MEKIRQSKWVQRDWSATTWGVVNIRLSRWGRTLINCHLSRDMNVGGERERIVGLPGRKHCRWGQLRHGREQRTGSGTRGEARNQIPPSLVRCGKSLGFHSERERERMLEVLRRKVISSDICFIRTTLAALWEQSVGGPGWKLEDYLGGYCNNPGGGQNMDQSAKASDKLRLNINWVITSAKYLTSVSL